MTIRTNAAWCALLAGCVVALGSPEARCDPMYSITGLGTLNGQSSSVATSINNQGQVVGISYNASDGSFQSGNYGPAAPPRFSETGSGATSFLYSNGQLTQINPLGGLATSINNLGQVVGGPNGSINDSGQYISGSASGVYSSANLQVSDQLSSIQGSGTSPAILNYFSPLAINNEGQIAGGAYPVNSVPITPAIFQDGQITNLSTKIGGNPYDAEAVAINNKGDVLITAAYSNGSLQSYLYHADTGLSSDLTTLPGGSSLIAAALNNNDQAVGNGYLYSNGAIQSLASLLPPLTGWSNLNATGINDAGQIIGQGEINGQEEAFLMTPVSGPVPEPSAVLSWLLVLIGVALRFSRSGRCGALVTQS